MSDQIKVNGALYSRASCQFKMNGEEFFGIDSCEWGQSRERGTAYGSGKSAGPRGRTRGRYKAKEFVLTAQKDTELAIKKALADIAPDGVSYGNAVVLWTITISEEGSDLEPQLIELIDCTLDDEATSVEDSTEHTAEKLTFNPLRIKENGLSLYDQSQEG